MALCVFAHGKNVRQVRAHRRLSPPASVLHSPAGSGHTVGTLPVRGLCTARRITPDRRIRPSSHQVAPASTNASAEARVRLNTRTSFAAVTVGDPAYRKARQAIEDFKPDFVLIFGDDQYEVFQEDLLPPFAIFGIDGSGAHLLRTFDGDDYVPVAGIRQNEPGG